MNINQLGENSPAQAAPKAVASGANHLAPVAKHDLAPRSDQTDMSMIGHLMARSVRALADSDQVRPDVLAQNKGLPQLNADFDNRTIDQILLRMQGR